MYCTYTTAHVEGASCGPLPPTLAAPKSLLIAQPANSVYH